MSTITLDPQMAQLLSNVIDCYLGDLRTEIRHTDNLSFKEMLKQQRELLEALQMKLNENQPQYVVLAS